MSDCLTYTHGRKDISTSADTLVLLFTQSIRPATIVILRPASLANKPPLEIEGG